MKTIFSNLLFVAMAVAVASCGDCPTDDTDMLLKHEDCDKFYQCTNGEKVERHCPENLYFNEEEDICDWPKNVNCAGRNIPVVPLTNVIVDYTTN
ncbi:unnamed protein product [Leptosia nina]|uniref:Chitin-binding type-2 domain-containing protein n=1 Tax=Leptosia nina TaxID=320188 RepID=A0AAV1J0V4_9NEOP